MPNHVKTFKVVVKESYYDNDWKLEEVDEGCGGIFWFLCTLFVLYLTLGLVVLKEPTRRVKKLILNDSQSRHLADKRSTENLYATFHNKVASTIAEYQSGRFNVVSISPYEPYYFHEHFEPEQVDELGNETYNCCLSADVTAIFSDV